jgi:predicted permease
MTWLRLFRRKHADAELRREMDAHVAEHVDALVERGVAPHVARGLAARAFGNRTRYLEESREVWRARWTEGIAQDVRFAARALRGQPLFCLNAVALLTFGIGLVTALLCYMNATMLRQWPVPDPSSIRLIRGKPTEEHRFGLLSNLEAQYFRSRARSFTHIAVFVPGGGPVALESGVPVADVFYNFVTPNYFQALGIDIAVGRGFLPEEEDYVAPKAVAIISDHLWRRYFNADPTIVGRVIRVRDKLRTIVGVAEPGFSDVHGTRGDLWMPLTTMAISFGDGVDKTQLARLNDPRQSSPHVFGRLAPGVDARAAQAELDVLSSQFRRSVGLETPGVLLFDTRPLSTNPSMRSGLPTWGLMFGALFMVLLLACANVGNMNLARALTRQQEIAMRVCLGASRWRVARQLLIESLMLSLAAGALGLYLAVTALRVLLETAGASRRPDFLEADALVFGGVFILSLVACVFSGLAPMLRLTRLSLATSGTDRFTSTAGTGRLRALFLAVQIALTMVLLGGATLLTRAVGHAMTLDPGFAVEGVQLTFLHASIRTPKDALREIDRALATVEPPVASAMFEPITKGRTEIALRRIGEPREKRRFLLSRPVSANYFDTLGIRVLLGRTFNADRGQQEIVLSESAARAFWPNENPIGQVLTRTETGVREESHEVVGVVADVATTTLTEVEPVVYWETDVPRVLLTRDGSRAMSDRIGAAVRAVAPGVEIVTQPLEHNLRDSLKNLVAGGRLAWSLGGLALLLATLGAFAVFTYVVEERRREIGVRMALGAGSQQVVRLVLAGIRTPVLGGLLVGTLASIGGARLLRSALYGLNPFDPIAYLLSAGLGAVAAAAATWIPARRATRIDPAITLRAE